MFAQLWRTIQELRLSTPPVDDSQSSRIRTNDSPRTGRDVWRPPSLAVRANPIACSSGSTITARGRTKRMNSSQERELCNYIVKNVGPMMGVVKQITTPSFINFDSFRLRVFYKHSLRRFVCLLFSFSPPPPTTTTPIRIVIFGELFCEPHSYTLMILLSPPLYIYIVYKLSRFTDDDIYIHLMTGPPSPPLSPPSLHHYRRELYIL